MNARAGYGDPSVLLIEPEQLLRWSVHTYLRPYFHVIAVGSVAAARTAVGGRAIKAIVASDDLIQEESDLWKWVQEMDPPVPFVRMASRIEASRPCGGAFSIEKPFDLPALLGLLTARLANGDFPSAPDAARASDTP